VQYRLDGYLWRLYAHEDAPETGGQFTKKTILPTRHTPHSPSKPQTPNVRRSPL
jgi:hypothetical protein